jgi:predicted membrane channel-forming protein YqfA (hemolysin III family)
VFHQLSFYLALAVGPALVLTTGDARHCAAAAVFAGCVAVCCGASALYHRRSCSRLRALASRASIGRPS